MNYTKMMANEFVFIPHEDGRLKSKYTGYNFSHIYLI